MDPEIAYLCEEIDAAVFSGDKLQDLVALAEFQEHLLRWWRETNRIKNAQEG